MFYIIFWTQIKFHLRSSYLCRWIRSDARSFSSNLLTIGLLIAPYVWEYSLSPQLSFCCPNFFSIVLSTFMNYILDVYIIFTGIYPYYFCFTTHAYSHSLITIQVTYVSVLFLKFIRKFWFFKQNTFGTLVQICHWEWTTWQLFQYHCINDKALV